MGSAAGVTVTASVGEWRWNPSDLDDFVTPILIEVDNNSDRSVRIRLKDIRLVGDNGTYLAALPPYQVRGKTTRTVESHAYRQDGFYVATHVHPYYPGYPRSRHHYYHPNYYYYSTYHPVYHTYTINLPTMEMLQRALPEGALAPQGRAMGFVYFERLQRKGTRDLSEIALLFQVVDAETQEDLDVISIRYDVRR